jgi:hypothetical protein
MFHFFLPLIKWRFWQDRLKELVVSVTPTQGVLFIAGSERIEQQRERNKLISANGL